jgi:predicted nucleic acid-binding protein
MEYYADSSFLVSCYVVDANTPQAKSWLSLAGVALPFTSLHALEVRNAFELGVFRRYFTVADAASAWSNVKSDLRSGRLVKMAVKWPVAFRVAARLAEGNSNTIGSRSLDILHVATAKAMRVKEFLSFDIRQRTLAAAVGLRLAP